MPALTPYPGAYHVVVVTGWRDLGFRTEWGPYSVSGIVAQSGTAKPRQGTDRLDATLHNRFQLVSHVESTRPDLQEGAED
jgi:hypothetical protein